MKNKIILGLFVAVCGLFLLTGCGGDSNKLVCSGKDSQADGTITIYFEDGKAKTVSAEIDFDSTEEAESTLEYYQSHGIEAKLSGKTITITNFEMLEGSGWIGKTRDEVKKDVEASGLSCK